MNKEIFLNDLRRFLSDMPEEEREQAVSYYQDYFEDAGPENEQKVIQELGAPVDIAKQIKSLNHDNIEYGHGNSFNNSEAYPGLYSQNQQSDKNFKNQGNTSYDNGSAYQNTAKAKENWTQDPAKIVLVIVLALLAIPVGIPVICTIFGLLITVFALVFSLVITLFAIGGSLVFAGVVTLIASCAVIPAAGIAGTLITVGIGLVLFAVGAFFLWFGILFSGKFIPAVCKLIKTFCKSIVTGIKSFFQ